MPQQISIKRALQDKQEGKAASTQAGEFIREEMHHVRDGKHGARSTKQAIAIGLSKARRAGVELPLPRKGMFTESVRKKALHKAPGKQRVHGQKLKHEFKASRL